MTQPHDPFHEHADGEPEDHDLGLSHDLPRIVERGRLGRRGMLGLFGGLGVAALAGCAAATTSTGSSHEQRRAGRSRRGAPRRTAVGAGSGSNVEVAEGEIPEETAGPFPGDGSNGPNVLTESGVVRSDITASFGSASGRRRGRADDHPDEGATTSTARTRPCSPAPRSTCGTATATASTRCTTATAATRTTCAACRRPTRTASWSSPASSRPATPVAGRTSTSRSTSPRRRHQRRQQAAHLADRHPAGRVRGGLRRAEGYERASPTSRRSASTPTWIFADGHSLQLAKVTGSVDDGYVATLNVPV